MTATYSRACFEAPAERQDCSGLQGDVLSGGMRLCGDGAVEFTLDLSSREEQWQHEKT